jgi:hypothetical protein
MNDAKPERLCDITTLCFMNLLCWFRIIILQDVVYLRNEYSHLKIWYHSVFSNPVFNDFAKRLLVEASSGLAPQAQRIMMAMPDLLHQLHNQHCEGMITDVNYYQLLTRDNCATRELITQSMQPIAAFMANITGSGVTFHTSLSSLTYICLSQSDSDSGFGFGSNSGLSITSITMDTMARPMSSEQAAIATSSSLSPTDGLIPQYRFVTHVKSVVDLWKEYTMGISSSSESVQEPSI